MDNIILLIYFISLDLSKRIFLHKTITIKIKKERLTHCCFVAESRVSCLYCCFRYLYRRNKKGITAKLDDDLLKFYCNEDTFLMQVTAIELEGVEGHESIMYDITLCELQE